MNHPFDPRFGIRKAQGDHGVDLEALRAKLDHMHAAGHTPKKLVAGLSGKLEEPKPEPQEPTAEQAQEMALKALAQCVAVAEGEFLDKAMRKIFRDDRIGASYNRRLKAFRNGDVEPMRKLLTEYEIEYGLMNPPEDYQWPEGCVMYRHLVVKKAGVIRDERIWEWKRDA
jgi:hypothetical protein